MSRDNSCVKVKYRDIDDAEIKLNCLVQEYKLLKASLHVKEQELQSAKQSYGRISDRENGLKEELQEARDIVSLLQNTIQDFSLHEDENKFLIDEVEKYKVNLDQTVKDYTSEIVQLKKNVDESKRAFLQQIEDARLARIEAENLLEANMRYAIEKKTEEILALKNELKNMESLKDSEIFQMKFQRDQCLSKIEVLESKLEVDLHDFKLVEEYKSELTHLKIKYETETACLKKRIGILEVQLSERSNPTSNIRRNSTQKNPSQFSQPLKGISSAYKPVATTSPLERNVIKEPISNSKVAHRSSGVSGVHHVLPKHINTKNRKRKLYDVDSCIYSDEEGCV